MWFYVFIFLKRSCFPPSSQGGVKMLSPTYVRLLGLQNFCSSFPVGTAPSPPGSSRLLLSPRGPWHRLGFLSAGGPHEWGRELEAAGELLGLLAVFRSALFLVQNKLSCMFLPTASFFFRVGRDG